jgi:hypothetical protein
MNLAVAHGHGWRVDVVAEADAAVTPLHARRNTLAHVEAGRPAGC